MIRRHAALVAALLLGACVGRAPSPSPPPVPPADALSAGLRPGPAIVITDAQAASALAAFRISCPSLLRRTDTSRIAADWTSACARAAMETEARIFFTTAFETAQVGDGAAMITGYYEPEIAASREPVAGGAPVYRLPDDLVEQRSPDGKAARGRVVDGAFTPYFDRTEIENGALAGRGLELGWAIDPVALFFLQIQGSGRLRFDDGQVMRIGYAGQNGHAYSGIGSLMRQRNLLGPGQASMQGIIGWIAAHPAEGAALMRENRSYVFFRELTGPGPLGALGLPVTPRATIAADPRFAPLGAPLLVQVDNPDANGLWIAQDTGGAIKGANRFDTFWGPGEEAARIAGGMLARGGAWLLLPRGTLARLGGNREGPPAQR